MGWLIALGVVVLLAVLPLGVSARYDCDGPLVKLIAGPVRIILYPRKKKEKKQEKAQEASPSPVKKAAAAEPKKKEKKGGSLTDFLPLVQTALDFVSAFRRKLRVNRLDMKMVMAADDPCDLAVNYGKAWAALGNLMPHLERLFVIKKRNLEVECDFTSDKTLIAARLDLTITLGRLMALLTVYGIRLVRQYFKIMKSRKGGADK